MLTIQGLYAYNEIEPLKWPVEQMKDFFILHSCCKYFYKGTENGENEDKNKREPHAWIIAIAPTLAVVCIGLFLVADNRQPLDCSSLMPKDTNINYWFRIVFLIISLICYTSCMIMAIILRVCSYFWTNKKETPAYGAPQTQHEPAQTQHEPAQTQTQTESSSLLHASS